MEKKLRILEIIYLFGIFLAIFIFFTRIHPLIIFDTDDWNYFSYKRHPIPLWKDWNPTKVFPEVFMPLCGDIAGFLVYPLTGDYILAFTLVNGAVVALFIVLYMHMLFGLLYKKWKLPAFRAFALSTVFLIMHFLVFRTKEVRNDYLFLAPNVTNYYFYLIPALLNCSLVLYLMRNDVLYDGWRKLKDRSFTDHIVRNNILFLGFYFALFSNLFQSVILAAFIGCQLLFEFINFIKEKGNFREFKELVKKNTFRLLFISAWALEQVFEYNGGRAGWAKELASGDFLQSVKNVILSMLNKVRSMNRLFVAGSVVVVLLTSVIGICCYVKEKAHGEKISCGGGISTIATLLVSEMLIVVYLILLFSRVNYVWHNVIWISILFFAFLGIVFCVSYILSKVRLFDILLLFACCSLIVETRTSSLAFADSKMHGVENPDCLAIDNDIISQFLTADKNEENDMVLYVPEFEPTSSNDNFPLSIHGGSYFSRMLYKHGVIDHPITVTEVIPAKEKNKQLNLD